MVKTRDILIAIDDSEASMKAVRYVAAMVGRLPGIRVHLVHVLSPIPPDLLEFGGADSAALEEQLESQVHGEQAAWIDKACALADPLFERVATLLRAGGLTAESVQPHHCIPVSRKELVRDILETAKERDCGTIVVGRHAFHGLRKLLGHHIADQLLRTCEGLTVWVVE